MTARNIRLYPWYRFCSGLIFWQAIWFLYVQAELSAAEAIALYAVYDISTTLLEVPSGYLSDRLGRKRMLIISAFAGVIAAGLQAIGGSFLLFVLGNVALGVSAAFMSGTDTALLYESLKVEGREGETERMELISWRYNFVALAVSAVLGGLVWAVDPRLAYIGTALAFVGCLIIAGMFAEPPRDVVADEGSEVLRLASLGRALTNPVLAWLFAISILMYLFSHIPFVFGQPFILNALEVLGLSAEAPAISGALTATMMILSVLVSVMALRLRQRIGLAAIVLLAFGMQVAIIAGMALTNSAWILGLLVLRMVPDSLSQPFILARIQPLLADDSRATYLSIKSLGGRLLFALTLVVSASSTSNVDVMPYADIQQILWWYVIAGIVCVATLARLVRRLGV